MNKVPILVLDGILLIKFAQGKNHNGAVFQTIIFQEELLKKEYKIYVFGTHVYEIGRLEDRFPLTVHIKKRSEYDYNLSNFFYRNGALTRKQQIEKEHGSLYAYKEKIRLKKVEADYQKHIRDKRQMDNMNKAEKAIEDAVAALNDNFEALPKERVLKLINHLYMERGQAKIEEKRWRDIACDYQDRIRNL